MNIYVCAILLMCLGMQNDLFGMMSIPKPRSESVPPAPKMGAVTITPRAASDSRMYQKKQMLDPRGKSFVPEFVMKEREERTQEDFAMMEAIVRSYEQDKKLRKAVKECLIGAEDQEFPDLADLTEPSSGDSDFVLPPLFSDEQIETTKVKPLPAPLPKFHTRHDDTTYFVRPQPVRGEDEEDALESAARQARLKERFAFIQLKPSKPSARAVVYQKREDVVQGADSSLDVGPDSPLDLGPVDQLQFDME